MILDTTNRFSFLKLYKLASNTLKGMDKYELSIAINKLFKGRDHGLAVCLNTINSFIIWDDRGGYSSTKISRATIANHIGSWHVNTVSGWIKKLEQLGYISVLRKKLSSNVNDKNEYSMTPLFYQMLGFAKKEVIKSDLKAFKIIAEKKKLNDFNSTLRLDVLNKRGKNLSQIADANHVPIKFLQNDEKSSIPSLQKSIPIPIF